MPQPVGSGGGPVYRNPFREARNLIPERVDQGVDFSMDPGSPIFAVGPGRILMTKNSGWPGGAFIAEEFTGGPYAGRIYYVAEDVNPVVNVGQNVDSNTIIGYRTPGTSGIETGWAAPPPDLGESLANLFSQWGPAQRSTAYGASWNSVLVGLGVPSGQINGPISGTTAKGYPTGSVGGPTGPTPNAFGCINAMVVHVAWLLMLLWMALGWR